jgi:hypothetical protein
VLRKRDHEPGVSLPDPRLLFANPSGWWLPNSGIDRTQLRVSLPEDGRTPVARIGSAPRLMVALFVLAFHGSVFAAQTPAEALPTNSITNAIGPITNGPAIFHGLAVTHFFANTPAPIPALRSQPPPPAYLSYQTTNLSFDRFVPESLNYEVWTNVLARTNGRTTRIWSERTHPPGWPKRAPIVKWDTNCLMWGMTGLTALSPCWEDEGSSGQAPVTALTSRHGYVRGHGMGADGFYQNRKNKKVWFLAADNTIVEAKVLREVIRCSGGVDYTIVLFNRDLPASIEPLRCVASANVYLKCPWVIPAPIGFLMTEQSGKVSAGIPGFTLPTGKAGDSGSPNLLPIGRELIFTGGRTTTGPTPGMQADMDELCRLSKLDPSKYQMRWADISNYPSYKVR